MQKKHISILPHTVKVTLEKQQKSTPILTFYPPSHFSPSRYSISNPIKISEGILIQSPDIFSLWPRNSFKYEKSWCAKYKMTSLKLWIVYRSVRHGDKWLHSFSHVFSLLQSLKNSHQLSTNGDHGYLIEFKVWLGPKLRSNYRNSTQSLGVRKLPIASCYSLEGTTLKWLPTHHKRW